jgi:hypothetical protein
MLLNAALHNIGAVREVQVFLCSAAKKTDCRAFAGIMLVRFKLAQLFANARAFGGFVQALQDFGWQSRGAGRINDAAALTGTDGS